MTFNIKELLLGTTTAISSIIVFWLWHNVTPKIIAGEFQNYTDFLWPVFGLIVAAVFFSLSALFIKNSRIIYGAGMVGISTPFLFVEATPTAVAILTFSLFLIVVAIRRIRQELHLSLGFSVQKILKAGIPLFFSISSLLIATYYLATVTEEKAISAILPKSVFDITLKVVAKPLEGISGLQLDNAEATIDEVLTKLVEDELKNQNILLPQVTKSELKRLVSQQREQLAKNFGINLTGNEKLGDVFYNSISLRAKSMLGPYKSYVPYASAIAFFLAFKTFTLPLYYFSMLITFVLIRILITLKILKVEKEQIEVERLTL